MNVVAHNIAAMNAQRQFNISANTQKKATEKLSSGYRINRAADDAAGLSISEKMRGQIRGLSQGVENTQAGVSLCQVADGALAEVNDMLHRITELSVKAANGTLSTSDRVAIQEEINQILTEIDRISDTTTFNSQPIFKGDSDKALSTISSKASIELNPGASFSGSGTITADDTGITCNNKTIPWSSITDGNGHSLADASIQSGDYNISFSSNLSIKLHVENGASKEDIIGAIDGATYNVQRNTHTPITITPDQDSNPLAGTMTITPGIRTAELFENYGQYSFSADENGLTLKNFSYHTPEFGPVTWADMGIDINNPSAQAGTFFEPESGVRFDFQIANNMTTQDVLRGFAATRIGISRARNQFFDNSNDQTFTDNQGNTLNYFCTTQLIHDSGVPAYEALGYTSIDTLAGINNMNVTIDSSNPADIKAIFTSERGQTITLPFTSFTDNTGLPYQYQLNFASNMGTLSISIKGHPGITQDEMLSYFGNLGTTSSSSPFGISKWQDGNVYKDSTINLQMPNSGDEVVTFPTTANQFFIQSGCDTMDGMVLRIDQMNTRTLGIEDINLTTIAGADEAMTLAGDALERLNASRTKIGAQQNRLEHTIANEENTVENTTSSESRIRDTDMAEEMVKYSTHNILVQAGQAMMAQANQSTQGVLSLLQ